MKDRAGNSLATARNLGNLDGKTLNLKDFVGGKDGNDLYRFSVTSSSQIEAKFSGLKGGAIASELYVVKNQKVVRKIGKTDFNQLKAKEIRNGLTRVARSNRGSVPQLNAALSSGTYFLRVRPIQNQTPYQIELSNAASSPSPNPSPSPSPNPSPSPSPNPSPGSSTALYNGTGLPKDQTWLDFNQVPTRSFISIPPFVSSTAKSVTQTPGTNGVTFDTADIVSASTPNQGYAGYSNYTASVKSLSPLNIESVKFNAAFPTLDRTVGYTLDFKVAVTSEVSDPNRAGFSVLVSSQDAKSIELGFKGDRIFAQSTTFVEEETALFNTSSLTDYKLTVKGDGYELFANNTSILKGSLRSYSFDPATSNPPLPSNPYTVPSLIFLGDNTDQGRATVTLGAVTLSAGS
jgi:hypothetical protein